MTEAHGPFIVVGVDGSEPSRQALLWGAFNARHTGAAVRAVMAWTPELPYTGTSFTVVPEGWDPSADAEAELNATIAKVLGEHPGLVVETRLVQKPAAAALLHESAGARMLVLGSRGHGGFAGLLLGSVSTACAAHAKCPVLIIHGDTPAPE